MQKQIVLLFGAGVYYAVSFYGLAILDAGLLVSALVLFGLPAYLLARYSAAPTPVITSIVALGIGLSLVLEATAGLYGLWDTGGVAQLRIFGLIPTELVLATILQTLFLALLYELLFDDGQYTASSGRTRFGAFALFIVAASIIALSLQYFFGNSFGADAYLWVVGILAGSGIAALALARVITVRMFDKIIDFSLLASIPLLIGSFLASANGHKIFEGNTYLGDVTLFSIAVPFEELLLAIAIPFFIGVIYEVYLDDQQ